MAVAQQRTAMQDLLVMLRQPVMPAYVRPAISTELVTGHVPG